MSEWHRVKPFVSKEIIDTAGAGDWLTAGFLNHLFSDTLNIDAVLFEEKIVAALTNANQLAQIVSSYVGAQGAFYSYDAMNILDRTALSRLSAQQYINGICAYSCPVCKRTTRKTS